MKKLMVLILTVFFLAGMTGAASADYIYANTSEGTPPNYWEIGTTSRPAVPAGVHPEYALGAPEEGLAGLATGWKGTKGELILGFDCDFGLKNVEGDDLTIWHFGKADVANVYVTTEETVTGSTTWYDLGTLSAVAFPSPDPQGGSGSVAQTFDFGALDGVHFVKIDKFASGSGTGHFIDAVAGNHCVPIPGAVWLFGSGLVALLGIRRRSEGRMISVR